MASRCVCLGGEYQLLGSTTPRGFGFFRDVAWYIDLVVVELSSMQTELLLNQKHKVGFED